MSATGKWLIWSVEHRAWWRADSNGYTTELGEAGTYSCAAATQIVRSANSHLDSAEPNEMMLPDFRDSLRDLSLLRNPN